MTNELSRSEQKRRAKQLEKLVIELANLSPSVFDQLPCEKKIQVLFHDAAAMKGGARKRQLKYITKLLRDEPVDELYAFLTDLKGSALQESRELHEVEHFREELLSEAIEYKRKAEQSGEEMEEQWQSRVTEEISRKFPLIDTRQICRLAWLYARTRNRKHSRELFRIIRAAREQDRLRNKET